MLETAAMIQLARGSLAGARGTITRAEQRAADPDRFLAYVATYYDLFWVLDNTQRARLVRLGPSYFDDDRGAWGLAVAGAHALAGQATLARAFADSARIALERQLQATPDDGQLHALLGTALAYLGRKDAAIREGRRALELVPLSENAFVAPTCSISSCGSTC